jgi:hypothetical protein
MEASMPNSWITGKKGALAPLLAVLVLVAVYAFFQTTFIECERQFAKCSPFNAGHIFTLNTSSLINQNDNSVSGEDEKKIKGNRQLIVERYNGRVVWVFLVAVSALLSIVTFFIAYRLIYISSSFRNENGATRSTVFLVLSLLFGSLLFLFPRNYAPIMMDILEATIAKDGHFGIPIVFGTMNIINSLTYSAAFMLVFASCAIVLPRKSMAKANITGDDADKTNKPMDDASRENVNRVATISEQMKDLRLVLYFGTFLLIIGVLRMSAVTQWTLAFISPDNVEAAKSLYISMASVVGGFNSLILAAVYLPAAYILQKRAQLFAKELPLDTQKEVLESKEFTFSLREALPRVLAILGPLLIGPIGELFKVLPT